MLKSLTIDDANGVAVPMHETDKRYVTKVSGLLGISPVRRVVRSRPTRHGGIDESHYMDGSLVVIEGETFSTVSIEDAIAEFRSVAKPLLETLDYGPALLKWTEGSNGLQLQKRVKLASDVDPAMDGGAPVARYQAQLYAEDPRAYSQAMQHVVGSALAVSAGGMVIPYVLPFTFNMSSGGQASVTNNGTCYTPPVIRVYGYCTAPEVRMLETSKSVKFTGEVGAGDFWDIDVFNRTVTLNDATNVINLVDFAGTSWFEIPPGTYTLQLLSSSFDANARIEVDLRDAY